MLTPWGKKIFRLSFPRRWPSRRLPCRLARVDVAVSDEPSLFSCRLASRPTARSHWMETCAAYHGSGKI